MTLAKCLLAVLIPGPPSWLITWLWYYNVYKKGFHFLEPDLTVIVDVVGPLVMLWAMIAAMVLVSSWREYKVVRVASKLGDIPTIMVYRFERVSPLVYTFLLVFAGIILFAFMGLNFRDAWFGIYTVSAFSYVFILYFFMLVEIDNPFSGFWFIRSMRPEWLRIDARKYLERLRKNRFEEWAKGLPLDHRQEILVACAEDQEEAEN